MGMVTLVAEIENSVDPKAGTAVATNARQTAKPSWDEKERFRIGMTDSFPPGRTNPA
jgi:hypothetical protein